MNLHTLRRPSGARKRRVRAGRGRAAGRGKTGGRGQKGQMSRKGHKRKPGFEGGQMRLTRRIPKRGFSGRVRPRYAVIPVSRLNRFEDGTEVTPSMLRERGMLRASAAAVKVLGDGVLTRKLTVRAHAFSAAARAKIEASGGQWEVISG